MKLASSRQRRKNDHCQWVIVETPSARSAIFPPLHHFLPFPPVDRGRINATAITIVSFRTESIDALGGMLRIVRRFSVNLNNEQQTKLLALVVKISSDKQFRENEKKKRKERKNDVEKRLNRRVYVYNWKWYFLFFALISLSSLYLYLMW